MLCPSCNTPNRDDAKFCKKCGHPLHNEQAKTPEAAPSVQAVPAPVSVAAPENAAAQDDISTAPTQIISPQQMLEMQARRWQQEVDRGQELPHGTSENENANANGSSNTASPPSRFRSRRGLRANNAGAADSAARRLGHADCHF